MSELSTKEFVLLFISLIDAEPTKEATPVSIEPLAVKVEIFPPLCALYLNYAHLKLNFSRRHSLH